MMCFGVPEEVAFQTIRKTPFGQKYLKGVTFQDILEENKDPGRFMDLNTCLGKNKDPGRFMDLNTCLGKWIVDYGNYYVEEFEEIALNVE